MSRILTSLWFARWLIPPGEPQSTAALPSTGMDVGAIVVLGIATVLAILVAILAILSR